MFCGICNKCNNKAFINKNIIFNKMIIKNIFDRVTAIIGFFLVSSILLTTWIFIRIKTTNEPAIYTQKRVGKDDKLFTLYKFLFMFQNHRGHFLSLASESRFTHLRTKLKKYKINELPELWNVQIKDISFIEHRLYRPVYVDH